MTADSEWDRAFAALDARACTSILFPDSSSALYIHAKAVVADAGRSGQQVFVGSENFSAASLDYNRELGIRTANAAVISAISATIASDYAHAKASRRPRKAVDGPSTAIEGGRWPIDPLGLGWIGAATTF